MCLLYDFTKLNLEKANAEPACVCVSRWPRGVRSRRIISLMCFADDVHIYIQYKHFYIYILCMDPLASRYLC